MLIGTLLIGLMLVAVIGLSLVILGLKELWDDLNGYMKNRKRIKYSESEERTVPILDS